MSQAMKLYSQAQAAGYSCLGYVTRSQAVIRTTDSISSQQTIY